MGPTQLLHSLSSAKLQPPTFFVITIIIRNYPEESNNPEHDAHEDLDDKLGLESVKTNLVCLTIAQMLSLICEN